MSISDYATYMVDNYLMIERKSANIEFITNKIILVLNDFLFTPNIY